MKPNLIVWDLETVPDAAAGGASIVVAREKD
jgi:hypothetical protein